MRKLPYRKVTGPCASAAIGDSARSGGRPEAAAHPRRPCDRRIAALQFLADLAEIHASGAGEVVLRCPLIVTPHSGNDCLPSLFRPGPLQILNPLPLFKILIMFEKMGDLLAQNFRKV